MTPAAFAAIASLVQARAGIVLTPDKDYMLKARLAPLAEKLGLVGLEDLARRLSAAEAEELRRQVVEALTTNETSFFRDGTPFEHLKAELARLAKLRPRGEVKLWSAACSTGQEAYSVAMLAEGIPGCRCPSSAPIWRARWWSGRARGCTASSRCNADCRPRCW